MLANSTKIKSSYPQKRSKAKLKSKSIDSPSSSNSEEANEEEEYEEEEPPVITSPSQTSNNSCDLITTTSNQIQDISHVDTKSQKNFQNYIAMNNQTAKDLIIEKNSTEGNAPINEKEEDKDEKELIKASQEINRSNRKLIKQSFNSNVLEIETDEGGSGAEASSSVNTDKTVMNNEDDDWDTL